MNNRKQNECKVLDIWLLQNNAQFGLKTAAIAETNDESWLYAYDENDTTIINKLYKDQKGAKRGFKRIYNKANNGREKVKAAWLSVVKEARKRWWEDATEKSREWLDSLKQIQKEANHV